LVQYTFNLNPLQVVFINKIVTIVIFGPWISSRCFTTDGIINCICVDDHASIRKYYKQTLNSIYIIAPKCKQLFFHSVKCQVSCQKKYCEEFYCTILFKKKSEAEAHKILVEIYSGHDLLETTCID